MSLTRPTAGATGHQPGTGSGTGTAVSTGTGIGGGTGTSTSPITGTGGGTVAGTDTGRGTVTGTGTGSYGGNGMAENDGHPFSGNEAGGNDGHRIVCRLDDLLADRGMTLTELAGRVGVTVVNLSILKNNRARAIRFSTLTAICEVLGCSPGDLLDIR